MWATPPMCITFEQNLEKYGNYIPPNNGIPLDILERTFVFVNVSHLPCQTFLLDRFAQSVTSIEIFADLFPILELFLVFGGGEFSFGVLST